MDNFIKKEHGKILKKKIEDKLVEIEFFSDVCCQIHITQHINNQNSNKNFSQSSTYLIFSHGDGSKISVISNPVNIKQLHSYLLVDGFSDESALEIMDSILA